MQSVEIPWDWYAIRASALVGFFLLYVSIFVGTVSCLPGIGKYFLKLRSLNFHCWISLQALMFAAVHSIILLFHKFIPFTWKAVFVPFASEFEPGLVAMGTISFSLMIILIVSSYLRKFFSYDIWRALHFLNIVLYFLSIVHALYLGTDLKSGILREIFIWANGILLFLLFYNLVYRIWSRVKNKEVSCETDLNIQNENSSTHQYDANLNND